MCSQPANVTILLQDELYTPYLGQLAKLAFLASAVHQAIFTIFSTLPFAVGQVRITVLHFSKLGPKGQPCKSCVTHMLPTRSPSGTTLAPDPVSRLPVQERRWKLCLAQKLVLWVFLLASI